MLQAPPPRTTAWRSMQTSPRDARAPPAPRLQIQNGHCGPWRPGRDGEVAASPKFIRGCVDLGVVTFQSALLEETGYRFVINRCGGRRVGSGRTVRSPCHAHLYTLPLRRLVRPWRRLRSLATEADVAASFSAMETMFYADGNFFQKVYTFLRDAGREEHAVMIRRALFLHQ